MVFILDEIDDICRREVETAAVRLYWFQHFAVVGNHHQTIARRGNEDVALTVAQGALDGHLRIQCRKVEAGIGQTAGGIIVAKDARAAYHQESAVVGLEIVFRGAIGRGKVLVCLWFPVFYCKARDNVQVRAAPDVVLVVFEYPAEEIIDSMFPEQFLLRDEIIALANAEKSETSRSDKDVSVGTFRQRVDTRYFCNGERVSLEFVALVVEAGNSCVGTHPQAPLTVAQQAHHLVAHERRAVVGVGKIGGEMVAVELVQSVFRSNPDESKFVLRHAFYQRTRHLVACIQVTDVSMYQADSEIDQYGEGVDS